MDRRLLRTLHDLFEGLPQVMFCIKDANGRYLAVNQAFADRVGKVSPADVVGLHARDVFPTALAASFEAQDEALVASGRPLQSHLELVLRADGEPGWYLTNKVLHGPVGSKDARIVSMSVDLEASTPGGAVAESLKPVVELVKRRFAEHLRVEDLAAVAGLSRAQLERRMRRVFGISVKQYLLRARLEEAADLLLHSNLSIGVIAARCGYYDQSSFTRHLKRTTGVTPGQLRSDYATLRVMDEPGRST